MKKKLIYAMLLPFLLVVLAVFPAEAATQSAPAFLNPQVGQRYPWTDGMYIYLNIDEKLCRENYGAKWRTACGTHLGEIGEEVKGVTISPNVPGTWTWSGGTEMHFTPKEPFKPGADYTVSLEGVRLPSSVRISATKRNFRIIPLSAMLKSSRLWIDPSAKAAHVLAASVHYTSKIAEGTHLPVFKVPAQSGLQLGEPEYAWNESRDKLTISAPVKALPANNTSVELVVPDIRKFYIDKDGILQVLEPNSANTAAFDISVNGQNGLFEVKNLSIVPAADENLNQGYELRLNTSLYARPDDVLKKLVVVELPKTLDEKATRPYNWQQAPALPSSALNRGRTIKPVSLQPDNAPVSRMAFRVDVKPKSYVLVFLPVDITSATGLPLKKQWREILYAAPQSGALEFLQPGNILPLDGKRTLDLYSTDLTEIRWEVGRIRDPFLALAAGFSDTPLNDADTYNESFLDKTALIHRGVLPVAATSQGKAQFSTLDLSPFLSQKDDGTGLMMISLQGYKDKEWQSSIRRMILVTDLGIIAKRSATGGHDIFVTSLQKGTPVANAAVNILGVNGRPVASAKTDSRGHAKLPALHGLEREQHPIAVTAQQGSDLAWLPLEDRSLHADYSAYPVSGRSLSSEGISSFVFAQRGVFRPGETMHFGVLTRRADWKALPDDLPLTAKLYSPSGTEIQKQTLKASGNGLADFSYATSHDAITGRYRLDIELDGGQILGSGVARLEEFQPDTMALKVRMAGETPKGWIKTGAGVAPQVEAQLDTLSGIKAAGHNVRAELRVAPAALSFKGYEEYVFHDAAPFKGNVAERRLGPVKTDASGKAMLPLPADMVGGSTVQCDLLVEGFEAAGGRAVSMPLTALLSPLDYMLGWKTAGAATNPQFLLQGSEAAMDFMAVDPNLKRIGTGPLTFTVYARRYVTSLVTDGRGEYRYDELPLDAELSSSVHNLDAANDLRWTIPTQKAGEYLLCVRDDKHTLALIPFTVAGERLALADGGLASGVLRVKADKNTYAAGEEISLFMQLPYDGTGLITVEREGVEAAAWFTAKAGETMQKITVPNGFEGRGFVNVTFVRSSGSPDVYREPSTSAIVPFTASIKQRDLAIKLTAPETLKPADVLRAHVTAREKGRIAVFAVDEGVLQLTRFATPSPLRYLLEDRALDVATIHALNRLMPDHARMQGRIPAFGGGMETLGGRFHNPFRRRDEAPVATWTLVDVGPDDTVVEIPIPGYYTGKLRVMAVGGSAQAVGSASASTVVSAPLMLMPRLPLTVTPGDSFIGTLVASNSTDKDMTITLTADAGNALALTAEPQKNIVVKAGGETVVPLAFTVKGEPGAAEVSFAATVSDGTKAVRSTSVSIRPPSHSLVTQQAGRTAETLLINAERDIFAHDAQRVLTVSALPLATMQSLNRYLELYPYGCLEQLVSRAFGVALLQKRPELLPSPKSRDAMVEAALSGIRRNLRYDGLSLWQGGENSLLLTAYAADLLLTMREQGMGIPEPLLASLCDKVEQNLDGIRPVLDDARAAAYGIWVLTREGRVTTQLLERLKKTLDESKAVWNNDITASLFAASQRIMHMRDRSLVRFDTPRAGGTDHPWFDELAVQGLYAAIIARHFPEKVTPELIEDMTDNTMGAVRSGQYATFSAAQALRALTALHTATAPALKGVSLSCAQRTDGGKSMSMESLAGGSILRLDDAMCTSFKVEMPMDSQPLYWQLFTSGFDRSTPTQAVSEGLQVERVYRNAAGKVVTSAAQGDELTVTITARANGKNVNSCIILDLLPGGMEMILPREDEQNETPQSVQMDRRDDRMILFTDLTSEPFTFSYKVRAANKGTFTVPAIQAEAMYDRAIHANAAGARFEIK